MTREEFNKKYYIEATVLAYQRVELNKNSADIYDLFNYEEMNALENKGYMVMDSETHDVVFEYEDSDEESFFEELKEKFNIID